MKRDFQELAGQLNDILASINTRLDKLEEAINEQRKRSQQNSRDGSRKSPPATRKKASS